MATKNEELIRQTQRSEIEGSDSSFQSATKGSAGKVAPAFGGPLGRAARGFANTNLGQNIINKADNMIKHPLGIINPDAASELENLKEDSDVLNAKNAKQVDRPPDMPTDDNADPWNNSKVSNNLFDRFRNKDKKKSASIIDLFTNRKRLLLIVGLSALLFLLVIVVVIIFSKDNAMLDLTGSIYNPSSKSSSGGFGGTSQYTEEEIQNGLLYIGDFRVLDMQKYIINEDISYIGNQNGNYQWLAAEGRHLLMEKLNEEDSNIKFVVFSIGLYDLNNADRYINIFNSLVSNYPSVNFIFMSINPVIDGQTRVPNANNSRIQSFNNVIFTKLEDKYVDTNSQIRISNSFDGVSYDASTYRNIHAIVMKFIQEHYRHGFSFDGEYPDNYSTTSPLFTPLITAIGAANYKKLNEQIKSAVEAAGVCTPEAAASAALVLAYELNNYGYRVPYYWGGGHDADMFYELGARADLGGEREKRCSSMTGICGYHYGFDCSGLIIWAVYQSVNQSAQYTVAYPSRWPITYEKTGPGSVLVSDNHYMLVLENKGDYLQTLESTSGKNGLVFGRYTKEELDYGGFKYFTLEPEFKKICGAK